MKQTIIIVTILAFAIFGLAAWQRGGVEKVGHSVDKAGKALVDTVTPAGPAQKAGRNIDNAAQSAKEALRS